MILQDQHPLIVLLRFPVWDTGLLGFTRLACFLAKARSFRLSAPWQEAMARGLCRSLASCLPEPAQSGLRSAHGSMDARPLRELCRSHLETLHQSDWLDRAWMY